MGFRPTLVMLAGLLAINAQAAQPPQPKAAYQAQVDIWDARNNRVYPAVVNAYASKMRIRMQKTQEMQDMPGDAAVAVFDPVTGEAFVYPTGRVAAGEQIVMKLDMQRVSSMLGGASFDVSHLQGQKIGHRTVAGEGCDEWQLASPQQPNKQGVACITQDGVVLSARELNAKRDNYLVRQISRGPQDAKLFMPPVGYRTVDMGSLLGGLQGLLGGSGGQSGGSMMQNMDSETLQKMMENVDPETLQKMLQSGQ